MQQHCGVDYRFLLTLRSGLHLIFLCEVKRKKNKTHFILKNPSFFYQITRVLKDSISMYFSVIQNSRCVVHIIRQGGSESVLPHVVGWHTWPGKRRNWCVTDVSNCGTQPWLQHANNWCISMQHPPFHSREILPLCWVASKPSSPPPRPSTIFIPCFYVNYEATPIVG
jgi:hypothetical protein